VLLITPRIYHTTPSIISRAGKNVSGKMTQLRRWRPNSSWPCLKNWPSTRGERHIRQERNGEGANSYFFGTGGLGYTSSQGSIEASHWVMLACSKEQLTQRRGSKKKGRNGRGPHERLRPVWQTVGPLLTTFADVRLPLAPLRKTLFRSNTPQQVSGSEDSANGIRSASPVPRCAGGRSDGVGVLGKKETRTRHVLKDRSRRRVARSAVGLLIRPTSLLERESNRFLGRDYKCRPPAGRGLSPAPEAKTRSPLESEGTNLEKKKRGGGKKRERRSVLIEGGVGNGQCPATQPSNRHAALSRKESEKGKRRSSLEILKHVPPRMAY